MKTFLFGTIAAVGLALGFGPSKADAAWVYQTTSRWDPFCGRYVTFQQPVWVPDVCPLHGSYGAGYTDPFYNGGFYGRQFAYQPFYNRPHHHHHGHGGHTGRRPFRR